MQGSILCPLFVFSLLAAVAPASPLPTGASILQPSRFVLSPRATAPSVSCTVTADCSAAGYSIPGKAHYLCAPKTKNMQHWLHAEREQLRQDRVVNVHVDFRLYGGQQDARQSRRFALPELRSDGRLQQLRPGQREPILQQGSVLVPLQDRLHPVGFFLRQDDIFQLFSQRKDIQHHPLKLDGRKAHLFRVNPHRKCESPGLFLPLLIACSYHKDDFHDKRKAGNPDLQPFLAMHGGCSGRIKPVLREGSLRVPSSSSSSLLPTSTKASSSPSSSYISTSDSISRSSLISPTTSFVSSSSPASAVSSSSSASTTSSYTFNPAPTRTFTTAPTPPAATPIMQRTYRGGDFFDPNQFWFANFTDLTEGSVNYLQASDALARNRTAVNADGTARLGVDSWSSLAVGENRDSVRISSVAAYDPGSLLLFDLKHVPAGCGAWPAVWMYSDPWPTMGEIDILEGVNKRTYNQMTIHTLSGCSRSTSIPITGSWVYTKDSCDTSTGSSRSVQDSDPASFGEGFNAAGGGVFAVQLAETGISIWRWSRSAIPVDVLAGEPRPQSWGIPVAAWDGSTCDTRTYFSKIVCGRMAGKASTWKSATASGPSCYAKYPTCADAAADPAAFTDAYFDVEYIKVFSI
ncbi:hypothetical protein JCM10213_004879 [Rhodosporidiobolus nylandii]